MSETLNIGIIGDFSKSYPSHPATSGALRHAAGYLSVNLNIAWLPTDSLLEHDAIQKLSAFSGLWAAPGSPYKSMEGAIAGIKFARESNVPFIGT